MAWHAWAETPTHMSKSEFKSALDAQRHRSAALRTPEDSAIYRSGFSGAGTEAEAEAEAGANKKFSLEYSTHFERGHTQLDVCEQRFFGIGYSDTRSGFLGGAPLCDSWGYASSSSSSSLDGRQHVAICQVSLHA